MIHINEFTPLQQKIIRNICTTQLESLMRLMEGNGYQEQDITLELIKNEVTEDEFMETLIQRMHSFEIIKADPQLIPSMCEEDISVFRHVLANLEDQYKDKYPKAIANIWNRLFILEEFNNMQKQTFNQN